jgi:nitrate reductase gamma subunit
VAVAADRAAAGPEAAAEAEGLTLRAVLWSILWLIVSLVWMQRAGLVSHGTQIAESVPVIPAVGAAIFFTLLAPLLRRLPRGGRGAHALPRDHGAAIFLLARE